nr:hypothetical protein [Porphyrostromium boryanum]
MTETFFLLPITNFSSVKRKAGKILYTELSYTVKLLSSIIIITLYRPANITLIVFYFFFLLLIYRKLYSTSYISYKQVSSIVLILKVIMFGIVFILGKEKGAIGNNILSTLEPNILVILNQTNSIVETNKIQALLRNIGDKCIQSIYRIEIASLVSAITSKLLMISMRPETIINALDYTFFSILFKSEIHLIYTFSSQTYLLLSEQISRMLTAIKIRACNNIVQNLLTQDKILDFFILYSQKKRCNLKKDIMISAQLNSNTSKKSLYTSLNTTKTLNYSNKILVIFISSLIYFLVSA